MTATAATAHRLAEGIAERERTLVTYVDAERHAIARACLDMARSFARGGTLFSFGIGPGATDAAHAAVEFMHPVIVGKRALPAIAPTNDPARTADPTRLARAGDIALGISHSPDEPEVDGFLRSARAMGLLTIALRGGGAPAAGTDHAFVVPSGDARIVQEIQETTYHVLWELVHTFFEHPGLLEESCVTCGDTAVEATVVEVHDGTAVIELGGARETVATDLLDEVEAGDALLCHAGVALERLDRGPARKAADASAGGDDASFLYPFLERREDDAEAVLADVAASTAQKARDVAALRSEIDVEAVARCGGALRDRLDAGGRLLCFGNGGSSTDAQDLAADCVAGGRAAVALTNDVATVTATANDVGFENSFSRQLIALGRPTDVAVAISTSGSSPNVVAALEEAHRRGLRTCAIVGYDGGRCTELEWLDDLFVVESDYVPRIQEAQATIYHLLTDAIGAP